MTRFRRGSMRVTGVPFIVTQIKPPPEQISPPAPGTLAAMTAVTLFVHGLMRATLPSDWLKTQTAPAPTVAKRGEAATGTCATTLPLPGSTRYTLPSPELTTQIEPKPTFTTAESLPTATCRSLRPSFASTWDSVLEWPSSLLTNQ